MQTSWKGEDSQSLSDSHNIACNFHMIQPWLGNVVAFLCSTAMALVFLELIFQKDHQILVNLVTIIIQHAWSKGAARSFSSPPDVPVPRCWNQFFRNVCWLHQCVLSLTQPQRPVDTHRDERGLEDVRSLVRMAAQLCSGSFWFLYLPCSHLCCQHRPSIAMCIDLSREGGRTGRCLL